MLVRQYFDATLPTWEEIYQLRTLYSRIYQQRLWTALELIDQLELAPGSTALDVGCGPGFGTAALTERGFRVCAADSSSAMVDLSRTRAGSEGVVSDIHALPFADATFDLVLVVGVTEWLASLAEPLSEVARVLKPGGQLVLSADNSWALSSILDPTQNPIVVPAKRAIGAVLRRLWPRRRPLRTHAYSSRALEQALRRAGLTTTNRLTLGFGPFTFFTRGILPDGLGRALDGGLQGLARRGAPLLRSAGLVHVLSAEKVRRSSMAA